MRGIHIRLELFGTFRLWVNGEEQPVFHNTLTRPWQMFALLALQEDHFLPDTALLFHLWGEAEEAKAKNSLKNTALRLRKELSAMAPFEKSPLERAWGGYRLGKSIRLEVDYHRFLQVCKALQTNPALPAQTQWAECQKLLHLYKGDFFCYPGSPLWMKTKSIDATTRFLEYTSMCCEAMWNDGMHGMQTAQDIADKAEYIWNTDVDNDPFAVE